MGRQPRIEFDGAWYHVMNRGACKQDVFLNDNNFAAFLRLLNTVHERYKAQVHAYCLMSNHYHLLIHTPLGNISSVMAYVNSMYTRLFNYDHGRDGPIFRGRYHAIIVDSDCYLQQVSRYIHLNPIKAHMAEKPEEYKWSSHRYYISKTPKPEWLYTDFILDTMVATDQQKFYRDFINDGIDDKTAKFYAKAELPRIFGDDAFTTRIEDMLLGKIKSVVNIDKKKPETNIKDIIDCVAGYYSQSSESVMKANNPERRKSRDIAIYLSVEKTKHKLTYIAEVFGCNNFSTPSKIRRKIELATRSNIQLSREINDLFIKLARL